MNQQQGWTLDAIQQLREMARERIPVTVMSLKLKRPVEAVRAKLAQIGLTGVES
ncbi:hypothetical protein [Enterovirga sp.]|uniref:hypothetical protein n=1 Tax=Enterovirga sp. TaxID=2026350 RepID=UPI002C55A168|nr:hypothetical protein [Enterovirga sp.]HMO28261.1 hypothetical protein [Enterovirga sp.]